MMQKGELFICTASCEADGTVISKGTKWRIVGFTVDCVVLQNATIRPPLAIDFPEEDFMCYFHEARL